MFTSIFDDAFFDSFNALVQTPTYQTSVFPPMNTYTTDEGMTFEFALAGYSKEELKVTIEGKSLVVKGTPKEEKEDDKKCRKYCGTPRIRKATFTVKRPITDALDTKKLKATYVDGLLTVFIPVKEKEESKDLEIEIL